MNRLQLLISLYVVLLVYIGTRVRFDPMNHKYILGISEERIYYESPSLYDFNSDPNNTLIYGDLILSGECAYDNKCPVMVVLHGSLGWKDHHNKYVSELIRNGIGVFKIYSFESRGISITKGSQLYVTHQMMISDAYSVLNVLSEYDGIDMDNIGITGFSLGGAASILSGWNVCMHQDKHNTVYNFNIHIGIYPPCFIVPYEKLWTDNPMIAMIGSEDKWTPTRSCVKLFSSIYDSDDYSILNKHLVIYPYEHHSFDASVPVTYVKNALNFEKCNFIISPDNYTLYDQELCDYIDSVYSRINIFSKCATIDDHLIGYNNTVSSIKLLNDYIYYSSLYMR